MFLKVKGGKVQSSRQGRFGARSESGHQPNSPARLLSLQSEGAQHHCVTSFMLACLFVFVYARVSVYVCLCTRVYVFFRCVYLRLFMQACLFTLTYAGMSMFMQAGLCLLM